MISSFTRVKSHQILRLTSPIFSLKRSAFYSSFPPSHSSLLSTLSHSSISSQSRFASSTNTPFPSDSTSTPTSTSTFPSLYNSFSTDGIDLSHLSAPGSQVDPYWLEVLSNIQKPSARNLIPQLVGENPLGFDSNRSNVTAWATTSPATTLNTRKVQSKNQAKTLLGFAIEQKKLHPTKILLIRTGDFYETYGVDSVVLVAYAGLNPMGNKCKAGCPVKNIQSTLDSLTSAGFTVAVYEEVSEIDLTSNVYAAGKSTLAASTSISTTTSGASSSSSMDSKSKLKTRALTQIISPGSRTYCYNLCMSPEDISFSENQPIVGIYQTPANGYTLVQVYLDEQVVKISERLSAESIQSFILQEGCVDPIFIHSSTPLSGSTPGSSLTSSGSTSKESILKSLGLYNYLHGHHSVVKLSGIRELDFSNYLLNKIKNFYKIDTDNFRYFNEIYEENNQKNNKILRPRPLYSSVALQIGLISNENVPFLLPNLLPENNSFNNYNSIASRFLKKWLLHPPPYHIADEMRNLCYQLSEFSHSIPNFNSISVGKLVSLLSSRQCNVPLFQSIFHNLKSFEEMILPIINQTSNENYSSLMKSLITLTTFQSGLQLNFFEHSNLILNEVKKSLEMIESVISTNSNSDSFYSDSITQDITERIPSDFYTRNEIDFRQKLNLSHPTVSKQYEILNNSIKELLEAVSHDFPAGYEISQDMLDNSIFLREKPVNSLKDLKKKTLDLDPEAYLAPKDVEYIHYVDRKGKSSSKKFTTVRVKKAVEKYEQACIGVLNTMQQLLRDLSESLNNHVSVILFVAHYSVILQSIYAHSLSSKQKGWVLPKLAPYQSSSNESSDNFKLNSEEQSNIVYGVKPYWMTSPTYSASSYSFTPSLPSEDFNNEKYYKTPIGGVSNDVPLNQMLLLTAPNMSGKSTLMRSVLVASLLANAGLFVPCSLNSADGKNSTVFPRFDGYFMRMSSYDIPVEGKSSFALEMDDMRVILKHATQNSLIMIDELGRGTSTREGTSLSSAFLEHINKRNITGIFATHLHELFSLPLNLSNVKNVTMGYNSNFEGNFFYFYNIFSSLL